MLGANWTSAVAGENDDPAFKELRNEALAAKFNNEYAEVAPLASSVFRKQSWCLTPRSKSRTAMAAGVPESGAPIVTVAGAVVSEDDVPAGSAPVLVVGAVPDPQICS